ncbi:hypothetical protein NL676_013059 [Syzygium grande]|nr:hypothetical protein NL676_013059 [Syzygium grande]
MDPHLVMTGGALLTQSPMDPLICLGFGTSHSRRSSDPAQNGDASSASNPVAGRTPNRHARTPRSGSTYRC